MKVKILRRGGKERERDAKKNRKEEGKKEIKEGKNRGNNTGMGEEKRGGGEKRRQRLLPHICGLPSMHLRLLPHQSIAGL
jgi:hypothetical protein